MIYIILNWGCIVLDSYFKCFCKLCTYFFKLNKIIIIIIIIITFIKSSAKIIT